MNNDRKATEVLTTLAALELNDWAGLHQATVLDNARQVFDIDEDRAYREDEAWLDAWFHPATRGRLRAISEQK